MSDSPEHLHSLKTRLSELLRAAGGHDGAERELRLATKECRDELYADNILHGGSIQDPFFNLIAFEEVAVFTFFEEPFLFYVLNCNVPDLICDTEVFSMDDVAACKEYLATNYGKPNADISVSRTLAEHWIESI
ncbi:MAG TPA: hypothetical protein PKN33_00400 [Phycisphaerae bacterium]|nr:hypothetical protein [Phycisphaerae bacterium]